MASVLELQSLFKNHDISPVKIRGNMLVDGRTGCGKSFYMRSLARAIYRQDSRTTVIYVDFKGADAGQFSETLGGCKTVHISDVSASDIEEMTEPGRITAVRSSPVTEDRFKGNQVLLDGLLDSIKRRAGRADQNTILLLLDECSHVKPETLRSLAEDAVDCGLGLVASCQVAATQLSKEVRDTLLSKCRYHLISAISEDDAALFYNFWARDGGGGSITQDDLARLRPIKDWMLRDKPDGGSADQVISILGR